MTGLRFVDPPAHALRRRASMSPGVLAIIGAIVAIAFMTLLMAMMLGLHLGLVD